MTAVFKLQHRRKPVLVKYICGLIWDEFYKDIVSSFQMTLDYIFNI